MSKSLRICLIGSAQSIHIQRWGAFLASHGHEVHVLSNFPGEVRGAKVWPLWNKKQYGNLAYFLSICRVYHLLRTLRPDVVHFHYLGGTSIYSLILDLLDFPVIIVATPWGSDIYGKRFLRTWATRRLLERSDKVITTSQSMSNSIQQRFSINPTKLVAYSWGVDLSLFEPALEEDKVKLREALGIPKFSLVVFSNRTMAPLYRTELIVKAFLKVREKAMDLFLVLLEGPRGSPSVEKYREQIKRMVRGFEGSIQVLRGFIHPALMSQYLKASDVVISIPISDQRSTSVLEALASCPILILSPIPPYLELQQEGYNFIMLPQVTEESLAEALLSLQAIPQPTRKEWLQANYELIAQRENWAIQAMKVEGEYYALLQRYDRLKRQGT